MLQIARLVGEVQVAAPGVIAFDPIGRDRFLDEGEGVQAGLVELAAPVTVTLEQADGTDLETRMDHAAVAAAGTQPSSCCSRSATERPRAASRAAAIVPV